MTDEVPTECLCLTYLGNGYEKSNEFFIPTELYYEWEDVIYSLMTPTSDLEECENGIRSNFHFHYVTEDGVDIAHHGTVTEKQAMMIFQKAQDYEDLGEVME